MSVTFDVSYDHDEPRDKGPAGPPSPARLTLFGNGLIGDSGIGPAKGMARAWTLTERGRDILQATGWD
jgi:hypothetical protein